MTHLKAGRRVEICLIGMCACIIMGFIFASPVGASGSDNAHFASASGIAVNSAGDIYVVDTGNYRIQVLTSAGTYKFTIGVTRVSGSDNAHFDWAQGVAVNSTGYVYVGDTQNDRVQVFDSAGVYQHTIVGFDRPEGVAVNATGHLYVADTDNHRVQVFDSSRNYQYTIGVTDVSGSDNAHLNGTSGVAVNATGHVYVADTQNHRVQVFDKAGNYQYTIGVAGISGADNAHFKSPNGMAVNSTGHVYVADTGNDRVQVFDKAGKYQYTIGVAGIYGADNAHFSSPRGIAVDAITGHVYVADYGNERVQVFDSDGNYLYTIGVPEAVTPADWNLVIAIASGVLAAIVSVGAIIAKRPPREEPVDLKVRQLPVRDASHRGRAIGGMIFIVVGGFILTGFMSTPLWFFLSIGFAVLAAVGKRLGASNRERGETPIYLTLPTLPMDSSFWKRELPSITFLGILSGSYAIFVAITNAMAFIIWDLPTIIFSICIALTMVLYYFTRWGFLEEHALRKLARVGVYDVPPHSPLPSVSLEDVSAAYGMPISPPEFINQPPRWGSKGGIYYKWYKKYQVWKLVPILLFGITYLLLKTDILAALHLDPDLLLIIFVAGIGLTCLAYVLIYGALRGRAQEYTQAVKINLLFKNLLNDLLMRARSKRAVDLEEVCGDHGFTYTTFLQKIPEVNFSQLYDVGDLDLPTGRFILKSQYAIPVKFDEGVARNLQQEIISSGQINLTQFCQKNGFDFKTMQTLLYQYSGKNQVKGYGEFAQGGDYIVVFEQGVDPQMIANLDQFVRAALDAEITGAGKKKGGKI